MITPQPGIFAQGTRSQYHLEFDLKPGAKPGDIAKAVGALREPLVTSGAGAFAAKADDPSAIFHNPAGLAKLTGTIIQLGINFVNFSQTFQREGVYDQCTDPKCPDGGLPFAGQPYEKIENQAHGAVSIADFAVVPLISAASDFGLDIPIVFAAGIFAPVSGSPDREYAPDYSIEADPNTPPPPGRYDIIRQEVVVVLPSPAGVGLIAVTRISLPRLPAFGSASRSILALYLP